MLHSTWISAHFFHFFVSLPWLLLLLLRLLLRLLLLRRLWASFHCTSQNRQCFLSNWGGITLFLTINRLLFQ
jgi:hypothetical protein